MTTATKTQGCDVQLPSPPGTSTPFAFTLHTTDGTARAGTIATARGPIDTPAFMPVGTAGTVKALYTGQVAETGAQVVLGNTYHLMLRPGSAQVAVLGGLHDFMKWQGPILTDSGGFQVMSLAKLRNMREEGVEFSSHIDGSKHFLSPERSIDIQCELGADIQMQLDECTPFPCTHAEADASLELSLRWAERSRDRFAQIGRTHQALYGIVQGSTFPDLREKSARALVAMDFPGYSIGGLAVGEGQEAMLKVLDETCPMLPAQKPRYLMGVGTPIDLIEAVARGVDMFDCVMPTRSGRHGQAFTWQGKLNLKNAIHTGDPSPLDQNARPLPHAPGREYSRAYLHHLVRCGEYLGSMVLSWNNIAFYQDLMARMREAIAAGTFQDLRNDVRQRYGFAPVDQAGRQI